MQGRVITKNANLFTVESEGKLFQLLPSGKTKESGIFVGDNVEFDKTITKVLPRRNKLIRPPLANVDNMFIIIAPIPKPDLILVDKIIIYSIIKGIKPIIVINKSDIASKEFIKEIEGIYKKYYSVLTVSAEKNDIKSLEKNIEGICAMAGQSAVGKSSIINALKNDSLAVIGELSKKINRGKQTTRIVNLYKFENGYIADTAGFSMLDLGRVCEITERELASYYPDFLEAMEKCKYRTCLHENEGMCGVIDYVNAGKIPYERYYSYLKILQELKLSKKF